MRKIYTIVRNIVVAAILMIVGIFLILYISVALPPVQNLIKNITQSELSKFLNSKISINSVGISPFNQVVLHDVEIEDQNGNDVLSIEKLGAGISLWKLILKGDIVITYTEIIGLEAKIIQYNEGEPLNIQFIIDALKPQNPNKPPIKFDLSIQSIVLRQSRISFDRNWKEVKDDGTFDENHIVIDKLKGDISLPKLANNDFKIDVRRISFIEKSGFNLKSLKGKFEISDSKIAIGDFYINLNESIIHPDDIVINIKGLNKITESIRNNGVQFTLSDNTIALNDFVPFNKAFANINHNFSLDLDIWSNLNNVILDNFDLLSNSKNIDINLSGEISNVNNIQNLKYNFSDIVISVSEAETILSNIIKLSPKLSSILYKCNNVKLVGNVEGNTTFADCDISVSTSVGNIDVITRYDNLKNNNHKLDGNIKVDNVQIGYILDNNEIGNLSLDSDIDLIFNKKDVNGRLTANIQNLILKNYTYADINVDIFKNKKSIDAYIDIDDKNIMLDINGIVNLDKSDQYADIALNIQRFNANALNLTTKYPDYELSTNLIANIQGDIKDDLSGFIEATNIKFVNSDGEGINYDNLLISAINDSDNKKIDIQSDIIDGCIEGSFNIFELPSSMKNMASLILPALMGHTSSVSKNIERQNYQNLKYNLTLKENNQLPDLLRLPIKMVGDIDINGYYNDYAGKAELIIDIPYLQQGKNKLITNSYLSFYFDSPKEICDLDISTILPGKNGDINLMLNSSAANNIIDTDIAWIFDREKAFKGNISLSTLMLNDTINNKFNVNLDIKPSTFVINDTIWNISPSTVKYLNNRLYVENIKVSNYNQHVSINGIASDNPSDSLIIDLKNMDLDYIFETLKINHVTFGGRASGKLYASNLLSKSPYAYTDSLNVKKLTYNDGLLGDAILKSKWLNDEKRVIIQADIKDGEKSHTTLDGGLWLGKDSLSFECNANYVNVKFLKPFLSAFTSDIEGRATGYAKLYGTFKDIDLIGKIYADTLRMKVDYTNTYYTCQDTVYITPGRIDLKNITLYDDEKNTAKLNGWVTHRYFHEPHFDFRISDVNNLLAYNTNETISPNWYGKVYGNGSCRIDGKPGIVNIRVDMTTAPRSKFTFVLNDATDAEDYKFHTFSDKAKEKLLLQQKEEKEKEIPDAVKRFRQKVKSQNEIRPSKYNLDLFITATPQAEMVIVMDPIGGDKIKAFGKGGINIGYNSEDELFMSGTYELEKGSYNFTLQDIIRKDFIIRPNSTISFNGDPFEAMLDIIAVYKVNTNLTDLDKSFTYDRDLNSTNIPVEAVLNVNGEMKSPNISFDIDLPTVTQDVVRKVKSIISTDDMMNRQIIYLLALNRFYTPEYMGTEGHNNELASVASSTISSQLSNIFGQLSDNWSFSPYFRTDKGDFSDMEVDLALSSSLLNNRLLLNGNFGYRDRTTSSTTFVGDFDIEYLLNRRGTIRLKAYNHYNDQNYYLKSALTTQGIGVIFKYDFDYWFSFLRKKEKKDSLKIVTPTKNDTILINN